MKKSLNNKARGFTLIELMVVLVIIMVSILMAAPSFNTFLANRQIRNVAESIQSGMLTARANAIKSGHLTMFILSTADSSWKVVELKNDSSGSSGYTLMTPDVDYFSWGDDYKRVVVTVSTSGTGSVGGVTGVTFDSFGKIRVSNPTAGGADTTPIGKVDVKPATAADNVYPLRVEAFLSNGRGVRLCAPHLPATDPKTCSP